MVRPLTPGDREQFIALGREFYRSAAVLHPIPDSRFAATFDAVMAGNPMVDAFLLESEGVPAGYAILALTWSNEAGGLVVWLEELYIAPPFQGRGLGQAFFAFMDRQYAGRAVRFRLEVTPENAGAIRLYRRLGYREFPYLQMLRELEDGSGM